jgi:two-component system chemotaxis response regulator CheB
MAPDFDEQCRRLIGTVKAMAEVKVVRRWPKRLPSKAPSRPPARTARGRILAIVASTGGPAALARVLSGLSPDFDAPILVVQHIAAGFVDGLAAWLNTTTSLTVRVAHDGEILQPRTVYLAPDGAHLGVKTQSTIALQRTPPIDGFRPSGTALFASVAAVFGDAAVAVLLTGMGEDGVAGLRQVQSAGGCAIAQDEATSVVFGMPGAAVAAGVVDVTLPVDEIASHVEALMLP